MKFSFKVFLSTITVVLLSFSVGGYLLITSLFHSALDQEITTALEENRMLRFSYEAALSGAPSSQESVLHLLQELSGNFVGANEEQEEVLRVYDEQKSVIFESGSMVLEAGLLAQIEEKVRGYQIHEEGTGYYIQTACMLRPGEGSSYYLENIRDISPVFLQREEQFRSFQKIMLVMTLVSGGVVFMLAQVLTKPIRSLSSATRRIAEGELSRRVETGSRDEIGALAADFNHMAEEVERRIHELEEMNRKQEDFVASFAHELKTPLTSVIGYADMLRSKEMDSEERFLAADYIFKEGKRLESLSLKLLDLIVLDKQDFKKRPMAVSEIVDGVKGFLFSILENSGIRYETSFDEGILWVEPDLFKTLLLNLLDNAQKAVGNEGLIQLRGIREETGYTIVVKDNGKGIPEQDLPNITEAFYVSDKSRVRRQGGAGLGLAICNEIVKLHKGTLQFESTVGEGTTVRIYLPEVEHAKFKEFD